MKHTKNEQRKKFRNMKPEELLKYMQKLKLKIQKAEGQFWRQTKSRIAQDAAMPSLHSLKREFARANTIYLQKVRGAI